VRRALTGLIIACAFAVPASAIELPPSDQQILDQAASWIANHPVTVRCMGHDEPNSPYSAGAWAYVNDYDTQTIYADVQVCEGALAIAHHDSSVPAWQRALGVLVITHESYHLRLNVDDRFNEGHTECRAIRHVAYMIRRLGGSPDELMPYALALHYHLIVDAPRYNDSGCKVPWWW
jgi:hypothetical protein